MGNVIKAEVKQAPKHTKTLLSPEHKAAIRVKAKLVSRQAEHSNAPSNRKRSKYLRAAFGPPLHAPWEHFGAVITTRASTFGIIGYQSSG
jgi:hypothetical protein